MRCVPGYVDASVAARQARIEFTPLRRRADRTFCVGLGELPRERNGLRGGGRRFFGATELAQALVRDLDETAAWRRRYGALFAGDAERRSLSSDRSH
jgi:hypothetical protein